MEQERGQEQYESEPLREADPAVGKAVRSSHLTWAWWIAQEQPTEVGGPVSPVFMDANSDTYCAISGVRGGGVVLEKALAPWNEAGADARGTTSHPPNRSMLLARNVEAHLKMALKRDVDDLFC